jgi:hypothetical protein
MEILTPDRTLLAVQFNSPLGDGSGGDVGNGLAGPPCRQPGVEEEGGPAGGRQGEGNVSWPKGWRVLPDTAYTDVLGLLRVPRVTQEGTSVRNSLSNRGGAAAEPRFPICFDRRTLFDVEHSPLN